MTVAQNIGFNQPKRLNKSYDKHAGDCFGIMGNRNNKHLGIFKGDIQNLVQSADDVYKDSYRYEDPAYNFSLIQKFLDNPISLLPLRKRYKSIKDAVEQLESELILLDPIEPYEKAFEFTCLITKLVGVL